MQIDLLYFDGCPSWEEGLKNLTAALEAEGLEAEVHMVNVDENAEATRLKFLGSPSFRLNDVELWPEERETYNQSCRVYVTPQGVKGAPTLEMIREKLCNVHA